MAEVRQDCYEIGKFAIDLPPIPANEMDLMVEFDMGSFEFSASDTTGTGDNSCNNTVILDNYGVIQMSFFIDPKSTTWADHANKQIQGDWPSGEKPTGSIDIHNHAGDVTSSWEVQRWFIRNFQLGPFDRKQSQSPMMLRVTIRPEKVEKTG